MSLYTFIMDFQGGTYISQVTAPSEKAACQKWARNLEISEIEDFGIKSKEFLINEMKSAEFVPLKDLKNAWCITTDIRGKLALINFIKTETATNANPQSAIQDPKSNHVS